MTENRFTGKGRTIGAGMPLICVPVTGRTKEEILSEIRTLTAQERRTNRPGQGRIDMIEWRADFFEGLRDADAVRAVLEEAAPHLEKTLFLFTIRSKAQGGQAELPEKDLCNLQAMAAAVGTADLVDLEYLALSRPDRQIRRLRQKGCIVIASHHDFERTPDEILLYKLAGRMYEDGADIAKLAVMPEDTPDVLALLRVTDEIRRAWPDRLLVTMSMGGRGSISRISGEIFGSCITFGSAGTASAPGQIPVAELTAALETIHNSLTQA